jgi:hypothetical protein
MKTKSEVVRELKNAVGVEREASTVVLRHLLVVETRRLYLPEKTSLFEFCMDVLGYSRHEAQARICAMRLMREFPSVERDIESGKLSLTVAADTQSAFRRESAARKKKGARPMTRDEKQAVLNEILESSTRQADRALAARFPDQPLPEKVKPVSATETRIEFTAGEGLMAKLNASRGRLAHKNFEGRMDVLIEQMADIVLAQLDAPVLRAPGVTAQQKRTRYVRKATRQQVWKDSAQGCQFEVNGKPCGSRHGLQMDHIQEFSQGGSNEPENLRLLCGAHNRMRSDRAWNLERMMEAKMERCREIGRSWLTE